MHRTLLLLFMLLSANTWAIDPPTLIGPCNGMMVDPLMQPLATWTGSAGAVTYNAQFSNNPAFSSVDFEINTSMTQATLGALWFDYQYYWRIRASDGSTWSAWSTPCYFTTSTIPPPPAPDAVQPACGSTGVSTAQTFEWSYAPGAINYELQLATNPGFAPATSYFATLNQAVSGLNPLQAYYWRVRGESLGGWGLWSSTCALVTGTAITGMDLHMFLQGPLDAPSLLMADNLRTGGLVPATEPYSALGFSGIANAGVSLSPALLNTTGNNAVVDWVLVEARHGTNSTVLRSWAMLVQRDGDLMLPDGSTPGLVFPSSPVRIAVRHRNHFGAMTNGTFAPNGTLLSVDFTLNSTVLYGTSATATVNGRRALWCGDTNNDGALRYTGNDNDRDPVLVRIGGSIPTATVGGYYREDVTLDGSVRYTGSGNDRDAILLNIGGSTPTATRTAQLP